MKFITLICCSMLAAQSAQSAAEPMQASEAISYADLNLGTAAGQQRLKDRISFAAYRLCLVDMPASPSPATADPGCYRSAMNEGLAQMDRVIARKNSGPVLAQAHH